MLDVAVGHASLLPLGSTNIAPEDGLQEASMKLAYSPASPYVRKVTACAIKRGLHDKMCGIPYRGDPSGC